MTLAVERPETLLLLLHDRPQLDRALDAAGIPPEGRTVQFSLASGDGSGAAPGRHSNPGPAFARSAAPAEPAGPDRVPRPSPGSLADNHIDITA